MRVDRNVHSFFSYSSVVEKLTKIGKISFLIFILKEFILFIVNGDFLNP